MNNCINCNKPIKQLQIRCDNCYEQFVECFKARTTNDNQKERNEN